MKLILSCSQMKMGIDKFEFINFVDLYTGPMWQQVKAAAFPRKDLAAISAMYGFLQPETKIRWYDDKMDEKKCFRLCNTGGDLHWFSSWVDGEDAVMFGGAIYRQFGEWAKKQYPEKCRNLHFVTGSFLQQRKRLGQLLRNEIMPPFA